MIVTLKGEEGGVRESHNKPPGSEKKSIESSHVGRCKLDRLTVVVLCLEQNVSGGALLANTTSSHQLQLLITAPGVPDLCLPLVVQVVVRVV